MLCRNVIRFLFGLVMISNAANLLIFTVGRLKSAAPPILPEGEALAETATANPLPQALILTALVIGFAVLAFVLVLLYRGYRTMGTLDMETICFTEPCALPRDLASDQVDREAA
jgi:multicomponent Na+:H+ antiporter subunit C